jgi:divalent metal cation (Fe/Co/Zn/Cd) transporter
MGALRHTRDVTMTAPAAQPGKPPAAPPTAQRAAFLRRRAFRLEYVTIAWNAVEGIGAIAAGVLAGSVALVAFGLDSSVEVAASLVVVWELRGLDGGRERRALRFIGTGYIVVAIYILWDAAGALLSSNRPSASPIGIVLLAATVFVMAGLGIAKSRVGREMDSATVTADGRFSLVDASLAGAVLIGLVLTAALSWWWADPLFALLISVLALREGREAWLRD